MAICHSLPFQLSTSATPAGIATDSALASLSGFLACILPEAEASNQYQKSNGFRQA